MEKILARPGEEESEYPNKIKNERGKKKRERGEITTNTKIQKNKNHKSVLQIIICQRNWTT